MLSRPGRTGWIPTSRALLILLPALLLALAPGADGGDKGKGTRPDTEQLRLALRDYRELAERLLHS